MENFDYEKAYKAVLQTATQWIKDGCTDKERICLESVFPELRESEDERIRKQLIAIMNFLGRDNAIFSEGQITKEQAIAYLERQKEQKPVEWSEEDRDCIQAILENVLSSHMISTICSPAETSAYIKVLIKVRNGLDLIVSKPQSEWSEEDEKMRNLAIEWAETMSGQFSFVDMDSTDFRKIISWLKSLRPQSKQEWSEEDKYILKNIRDFVKENTINPNRVNCAEECLKWINALPERFNLRPKQEWSEEDER